MTNSISVDDDGILVGRCGSVYGIGEDKNELKSQLVVKLQGSRPPLLFKTHQSVTAICGNQYVTKTIGGGTHEAQIDPTTPPSKNTLLTSTHNYLLFHCSTGAPPKFQQSVWVSPTDRISSQFEIPVNNHFVEDTDTVTQGMLLNDNIIILVIQSMGAEPGEVETYLMGFKVMSDGENGFSHKTIEIDVDTLSMFQIEERSQKMLLRHGDDIAVCTPIVVQKESGSEVVCFTHDEQIPGMNLIASSRPKCCRVITGTGSFPHSLVALVEDDCVTVFSRCSRRSASGCQVYFKYSSLVTSCCFRVVGGVIELLVSTLSEFHLVKLSSPTENSANSSNNTLSEDEERRIAAVLSANADW
eukprot:TRINITY_DN19334_c0_g1_i1.p1 TRINITY_DN19334_c0_g1~~TRINITY_DN19334_c0_g1_i1.p1  ORF type:complete len:416 (+),score=76.36 TRINITY_DN19334_c0_g1_i1:179-1249(+)